MDQKNNDVVLVRARAGGQVLEAYGNRLEVSLPRMLTMGLSKKRETYAYSAVRDVGVKGGTLTVRFGPMSVRRYGVGRRKAREIADLIRQSM